MLLSDHKPLIEAVHIFVYGHVQGVGFRAWSASVARREGITGFVRNCPDYSVELFAEGESEAIRSFTSAVRKGPTYSSVEKITVDPAHPRGYTEFLIEY